MSEAFTRYVPQYLYRWQGDENWVDATANGGRVHTVERAKRCLASFKEKGTPTRILIEEGTRRVLVEANG
jgi:hypothetical protein